MINLFNTPDFTELRKFTPNYSNIHQIFIHLINELKAYLKLDLVNGRTKIEIIKDLGKEGDFKLKISKYGISRFIEENTYHIKILESFSKFFPFFLLKSAYLTFVPNNLKNTKFINFAINQFVEFDLQDFCFLDEWKILIEEPNLNIKFRFEKNLRNVYSKF